MLDLSNLRVAVLAADGFEESELTVPVRVLGEAGAQVEIVASEGGQIQGFRHFDKGIKLRVDRSLHHARSTDYDALVLPGGALNADALRMDRRAQEFVREFQDGGKPIAVICHGPWLLVSAGLVRGRTLTSYYTIQDDIRNAGGIWKDQEVVADDNWVSSRSPKDLPAFTEATLRLFARVPVAAHI
jgi:protease I